jgi:hypothetical protein
MVGGRIVGVEAETKSALASQRAMATAAVATGLGQHREHIVPKIQFSLVVGSR